VQLSSFETRIFSLNSIACLTKLLPAGTDPGADIMELRKRRIHRRRTLMERRNFSTIIPSLVPETSDIALDRLLVPARHFRHPDDVLADHTLDLQEKRAILSSWASDACAVESMPALRQPPGGEPVSFDQIMDALMRLDDEPTAASHDCCDRPMLDRLDA
jgi:hypothetical protein